MSGCSAGMAGSMFCESCHNYDCTDNPDYYKYHKPKQSSNKKDKRLTEKGRLESFYKEYNLEHMRGVKAPDIPIIEDIQKETKEIAIALYDNFLNL